MKRYSLRRGRSSSAHPRPPSQQSLARGHHDVDNETARARVHAIMNLECYRHMNFNGVVKLQRMSRQEIEKHLRGEKRPSPPPPKRKRGRPPKTVAVNCPSRPIPKDIEIGKRRPGRPCKGTPKVKRRRGRPAFGAQLHREPAGQLIHTSRVHSIESIAKAKKVKGVKASCAQKKQNPTPVPVSGEISQNQGGDPGPATSRSKSNRTIRKIRRCFACATPCNTENVKQPVIIRSHAPRRPPPPPSSKLQSRSCHPIVKNGRHFCPLPGCGMSYSNKSNVRRHMKNVHLSKISGQSQVPKKFTKKTKTKKIPSSKTKNPEFPCTHDGCKGKGVIFRNQTDLNCHLTRVHPRERSKARTLRPLGGYRVEEVSRQILSPPRVLMDESLLPPPPPIWRPSMLQANVDEVDDHDEAESSNKRWKVRVQEVLEAEGMGARSATVSELLKDPGLEAFRRCAQEMSDDAVNALVGLRRDEMEVGQGQAEVEAEVEAELESAGEDFLENESEISSEVASGYSNWDITTEGDVDQDGAEDELNR